MVWIIELDDRNNPAKGALRPRSNLGLRRLKHDISSLGACPPWIEDSMIETAPPTKSLISK